MIVLTYGPPIWFLIFKHQMFNCACETMLLYQYLQSLKAWNWKDGQERRGWKVDELHWGKNMEREGSQKDHGVWKLFELQSDLTFTFCAATSSGCGSGTTDVSILTFFDGTFFLIAPLLGGIFFVAGSFITFVQLKQIIFRLTAKRKLLHNNKINS